MALWEGTVLREGYKALGGSLQGGLSCRGQGSGGRGSGRKVGDRAGVRDDGARPRKPF